MYENRYLVIKRDWQSYWQHNVKPTNLCSACIDMYETNVFFYCTIQMYGVQIYHLFPPRASINLHFCAQTRNHNFYYLVFSCPGSSIPDLGHSLGQSVTECHFRILTQRVTFETSDPSDIWSEWKVGRKKLTKSWQKGWKKF